MGNTHDDDEVEIDLRELFYALKKHILVILAAILAGAVIAGAATKLLMTPVYSATCVFPIFTPLYFIILPSAMRSAFSFVICLR